MGLRTRSFFLEMARIVPIREAGKPAPNLISYRATPLFPFFLDFARIVGFMERHKKLLPEMRGFCGRPSSQDRLSISQALSNMPKRVASRKWPFFWILTSAFENACVFKVVAHMKHLGDWGGGGALCFLSPDFSNRCFAVKTGNLLNAAGSLASGLPSGSALSPILITLVMAGVVPC